MCSDLDGMVKTAWMFKKKKQTMKLVKKKGDRHCSPMCLCWPLASEFKWREKKAHENLFGVVLEQLGELIWAICSREMDTLQQGSGRKKVKKKKKKRMCLMMYHVCLIPFCIIDMDLAVFFFKQLNNLLPCANSARPRCGQNASSHLVFFSFLGAQEARNLWRSSPALMELMWLKQGISFPWKSFAGGGWSEENMDSS